MRTNSQHESSDFVVTFGSLSDQGRPLGPVPPGYGSFMWSESAWFMTREHIPSLRSAKPVVLFNANGEDLSFKREEPFTLKVLSLSALWEEALTVIVEGWERGESRYRKSFVLKRNLAIRPELDFTNVDRVALTAGGAHFAIQTITIAENVRTA